MKRRSLQVSCRRQAEGTYRVLWGGEPTEYLITRNDNAEPALRWAVEQQGESVPLFETFRKGDAVYWVEWKLRKKVHKP